MSGKGFRPFSTSRRPPWCSEHRRAKIKGEDKRWYCPDCKKEQRRTKKKKK